MELWRYQPIKHVDIGRRIRRYDENQLNFQIFHNLCDCRILFQSLQLNFVPEYSYK